MQPIAGEPRPHLEIDERDRRPSPAQRTTNPRSASESRVPSPQSLEVRLPLLALLGALPAVLVALWWLWGEPHGVEVRWTLTVVVVVTWLACAASVRARVERPLHLLANLLAALREGDYSVRGAGARGDDALGAVLLEVNTLGAAMQAQRLAATEAGALLRTVMAELDVAVFAFDHEDVLRLVNRGGERVLDRDADGLLGRSAAALGLAPLLDGEAPRTVELSLPGAAGRWEARRTRFRQDGRPHQLLVLTDVSRALREEERLAWQRLVRVLSHEMNNSLAPIRSISRSLRRILGAGDGAGGSDADEVRHGLTVIEGRAGSLIRFLQAYARLARLPRPTPRPVAVDAWVARVAALEKRHPVAVRGGPPLVVRADPDQLEQLLINLVRNAVEAVAEVEREADGARSDDAGRRGRVDVAWRADGEWLVVTVDDDGPGIAETSNLFVPFFTTKPEGSGIGLALSRQIAEAHGGALTLENRAGERGCRATVRLPMAAREAMGAARDAHPATRVPRST